MLLPTILSVAAVLIASLIVATPNRKGGCLIELAHLFALVGGAAAPAVLVWRLDGRSAQWWFWPVALLSLLLGACAVGLATFAWHTLFPGLVVARPKKRRRAGSSASAPSAARPADLEKQVDLSIFDPVPYLNFSSYSNTSPAGDALDSCIFSAIMAVLGGLFWLGIQLAQGIASVALPGSASQEQGSGLRLARGSLSLLYGLALAVLTSLLLYYASR